jgi:hypothetical protein
MAEPIATDISQQFRTLDPTTRELFFGSGIPGTSSYSPGFMQQAFRASEKTFYDEQGNPIVVPEQVAGLSPEQLAAINLSREKIGVQDPYLFNQFDEQNALTSMVQRDTLGKVLKVYSADSNTTHRRCNKKTWRFRRVRATIKRLRKHWLRSNTNDWT